MAIGEKSSDNAGSNIRHQPTTVRKASIAATLTVAVATIAAVGVLTNRGNVDGWYANAEKVSWTPPNWVFGPAWTVLYVVIVIVGYLIWRRGFRAVGLVNAARPQLRCYVTQLVLNALWSPVFFAGYPLLGKPAWWLALVIIVTLNIVVARLIYLTYPISRVATWLLVPYLAWLLYATTLNAGIIVLN